MALVLAATLSLIFLLLGGLHFYWVLGGTRWLAGAMPPEAWEQLNRKESRMGFSILTAIVGVGLLGMAVVVGLNLYSHLDPGDMEILRWITLAIGGIFALRAVGDFSKIGLFQRGQTGVFAERDKAVYSPLCAFIATGCFLLVFVF